ncbi:MAG: exonuclease SbcCD subunit D C-terminal domain-containing protein [Ginsengibacter sp.]
MKILHTADWHIGQLFHEYDRTYEHQQFLDWLVNTLREEQVDVVLISGDVFDLSNPSAASIKMFYTFLNKSIKINPCLQIIITAGNHDSASRLESPKPLLESSNIHIIGVVEKDVNGNIDYEKLIIPLKDNQGKIKIWCMAVPFLRMGDYPVIPDCDNPYAEGVAKLYEETYQFALSKIQAGQSVICMGHLHTQLAEKTGMDELERKIMGGIECISAAAFHEDIKYVALGHIHKAQRIGGKDHIRYCGSPIPMSFSELNYKHQVIVFELEDGNLSNLRAIEVPVTVPLLAVPSRHSTFSEVLSALEQLPPINDQSDLAPYLEVRVLLDSPEPALRFKIQSVLNGKNVRLATINAKKYPNAVSSENNGSTVANDKLQELQPSDIFSKIYQSRYNNPVPESIQELFNQVAAEVSQMEVE